MDTEVFLGFEFHIEKRGQSSEHDERFLSSSIYLLRLYDHLTSIGRIKTSAISLIRRDECVCRRAFCCSVRSMTIDDVIYSFYVRSDHSFEIFFCHRKVNIMRKSIVVVIGVLVVMMALMGECAAGKRNKCLAPGESCYQIDKPCCPGYKCASGPLTTPPSPTDRCISNAIIG